LSDSVENEWLCLNILSAYHLPVNYASIVHFDDVFDNMENVINQVTELLPKNFPQQISEAIFAGMRKIKGRMGRPDKQTYSIV
jgi:hypothetical protein